MTPMIEASPPATWQDLEARVAQILQECGYDVEVQKNVALARGDVDIDVWADDHSSPPNVIAVECKHWATPATKNVVHAFRTVVGDSGANTGLLVSSAGFQNGAVEAAAYSNVRLLDWRGFQTMFVARWFRKYFARNLAEETGPLHEYTEPINSRIVRKATALSAERRELFNALTDRHLLLATTNFTFHPIVLDGLQPTDALPMPTLPLRESAGHHDRSRVVGSLPDEVLDAMALRPLLEAMIEYSRRAIAEFDEVFGERA